MLRVTLPFSTVTVQVAFKPVALEVQVIVTLPAFTAVTFPAEETVAIFVSELFQVTVLSVNDDG